MNSFDWMAQGACAGKPADWWFDASTERAAIRICSGCPVQTERYEHAVNDPEITDGIFGGATRQARNNERLRRGIPIPSRYEGAYRAARTTPRKAEP